MYIRPVIIGTGNIIGMGDCNFATLFVICSPCAGLYKKSLSLLATEKYVRAWPGGTGSYKLGG